MGKSLIVKGADFSANGMDLSYDITSLASSAWYPRYALNYIGGKTKTQNNKRCCVQQFELSNVPNISNYTKIRIIFAEDINYVMTIGTGTNDYSGYIRVTGIDTYDTTFAWVADNSVAEIELNDARHILNVNVKFSAGGDFPTNAKIEDYMRIILL